MISRETIYMIVVQTSLLIAPKLLSQAPCNAYASTNSKQCATQRMINIRKWALILLREHLAGLK